MTCCPMPLRSPKKPQWGCNGRPTVPSICICYPPATGRIPPVTPVADRSPRLSVVIPCYDEAAGMTELYRRVTAACRETVGEDHEIVFVNDGSRDATWTVM